MAQYLPLVRTRWFEDLDRAMATVVREDEIIPCLKCFVCLSYDMEEEFCCSGNPAVGREYILGQLAQGILRKIESSVRHGVRR